MNTTLLLQNISRHILLDKTETDFFLSLLEYRKVKKKFCLVREGDIVRHEYFVLRGCFKTYSVDEKGNEHITMFASEGWWTGNICSFLTGNPSDLYTEALEDSEVVQISKENKERLFEQVPKFERFFRILYQNALMSQFQRINQNLSLLAADKYRHFQAQYPTLEQRLPQKQIASFLGITPEFLSIIRRRQMTM